MRASSKEEATRFTAAKEGIPREDLGISRSRDLETREERGESSIVRCESSPRYLKIQGDGNGGCKRGGVMRVSGSGR